MNGLFIEYICYLYKLTSVYLYTQLNMTSSIPNNYDLQIYSIFILLKISCNYEDKEALLTQSDDIASNYC